MGNYTEISFEIKDNIAHIRLNKPEVMNALSPAVNTEITSAIIEAGQSAKALIITGEGRAFSSGANLSGKNIAAGPDLNLGQSLTDYYSPMINALMDSPIPTIAAVNGPSVGFGCSLALACDIIYAAESAYFQQAFVNIGLVPDGASAYFLVHSVGRARASEFMLTGEKISSKEAHKMGMINHIVADENLNSTALEQATKFTHGAPIALELTRKLAWKAINNDVEQQLELEAGYQTKAGRTKDFFEGAMAFMQKRLPKFTGK